VVLLAAAVSNSPYIQWCMVHQYNYTCNKVKAAIFILLNARPVGYRPVVFLAYILTQLLYQLGQTRTHMHMHTHAHTRTHTHTHTNLYLLYLYAYLLLPELAVCMALIQGASQQEATRPWCSCWQREHQPYLPSCLALTVARPMRRGRWGTTLSDGIRMSILDS